MDKLRQDVLEELDSVSENYIKSLDSSLITTDFFEFRCNCVSVNEESDQEYRYESLDNTAYYQILIEQKTKEEAEQTIQDVKKGMITQGVLINDMELSEAKGTELHFSTGNNGLFSNARMILLYKKGYFIAIIISSKEYETADRVITHFKQTFKLKI